MKIKVWVCTNKLGSRMERIFEADDEDDADAIDEVAGEIKDQMIDWGWSRLD